jgi:hypothetical protein
MVSGQPSPQRINIAPITLCESDLSGAFRRPTVWRPSVSRQLALVSCYEQENTERLRQSQEHPTSYALRYDAANCYTRCSLGPSACNREG